VSGDWREYLALHATGRVGEQTKAIRSRAEALVSGPQLSVGGQAGGGEELDVDVADVQPEQPVALDKGRHLRCGRNLRLRNAPEQPNDLPPLR